MHYKRDNNRGYTCALKHLKSLLTFPEKQGLGVLAD
jgi:hypothetical protein